MAEPGLVTAFLRFRKGRKKEKEKLEAVSSQTPVSSALVSLGYKTNQQIH